MHKTALVILLVGFAFAYLALPLAGIDLLIDAVGFLLIFNGVRALQKLEGGFGPAAAVSILLVVVSALQLFLTAGLPAQVLLVLRAAAEAVLYVCMLRGLAGMALRRGNKLLRALCFVALALALAACAITIAAIWPFAVRLLPLVWFGQVAVLAVLGGFLLYMGPDEASL